MRALRKLGDIQRAHTGTQRKETMRTICTEFLNSGTEVAAPKHPLSRNPRRREAGPGAGRLRGGASEGRDLAVYKECGARRAPGLSERAPASKRSGLSCFPLGLQPFSTPRLARSPLPSSRACQRPWPPASPEPQSCVPRPPAPTPTQAPQAARRHGGGGLHQMHQIPALRFQFRLLGEQPLGTGDWRTVGGQGGQCARPN